MFFVNALLPWDNDYFVKKEPIVPSDTTQYTQHLLNMETRSDEEFWVLYNNIHTAYQDAGLPGNEWLNLYQGYKKKFILDRGTDDLHPGPLSNKAFSDFLIQKIKGLGVL